MGEGGGEEYPKSKDPGAVLNTVVLDRVKLFIIFFTIAWDKHWL